MTTAVQLLLTLSAATGLVAGVLPERATSSNARTTITATQEEAMKKSPLSEAMDVLKKGQRALRKQVRAPEENKDAMLANLAEMEKAAYGSIMLLPKAMETVPAEQLAEKTVAYKLKMTTLLMGILSMEEAAMSGNVDALKAASNIINDAKSTGHEAFRD